MEALKSIFQSAKFAYLFIGLVSCFFIYQTVSFEPHDFSNYYFGATFLTEGHFNTNIFFPHHFNLNIASAGHEGIYTSYAPHNPFLALFFAPFTLFSVITAKLIFNVLGLGLFLFSLRNLINAYPIRPFYLFLLPLLFFIPLRNNFLFGQMYLLLFFLLVEGFLAYKKERYLRMGLFWGVAVMLKVIPVILFGFLLFKKQFGAIFYFGLSCALLLGISLLVSGYEVWVFYFTNVLPKSGNGEITTEFVQNYQSVFMFLKGLLPESDSLFLSLLFLFKLVILVLAYFITRKESSILKIFSFWIFASILLSPYGSTYTAILLIIPFIHLVRKQKFDWELGIGLILIFLISNVPISYFTQLPLPFSFPRLGFMLILFFVLIKSHFKMIDLKWTAVLIIPLMICQFLIHEKPIEPGQPLLKDAPLLTYEFESVEGRLGYTFWSPNGAQQKLTDIIVTNLDTKNVKLKEGQLFFDNRQLTFDKSQKMSPCVLNDTAVIYLSDYKRGIGFFQMRTISIANMNK